MYMLSKRVELITVQTDEHQDALKLVSQLRKLVEYNQKLNRNYSVRVATSLVIGSLMFLQSISAYWQVYGLHYVVDCFEYHVPIATVFGHEFVLYELLSVSWSSTGLNKEPTSSGTGYGKSRTLTGNEVLSRRQTKHDPPEILRGASLGERRKQKESKTTPQGKPGVISPRTPPQPHQYPEHDQRCHRGRPSDEKRGPSATTSPIRDQPTQQ
ncbi:hypothetical protein J6590_065308 [Homalodisca vitripennis]|nr:hypothetical protein J6590_065308 [Homalodisca vitripennis]